MQRSELSGHERERQHRYAETILARELGALAAMVRNSGRNQAAFRLVCRVGRWAHHDIISCDRLIAGVLDACERNDLVRDDGRKAVLATIARSGTYLNVVCGAQQPHDEDEHAPVYSADQRLL